MDVEEATTAAAASAVEEEEAEETDGNAEATLSHGCGDTSKDEDETACADQHLYLTVQELSPGGGNLELPQMPQSTARESMLSTYSDVWKVDDNEKLPEALHYNNKKKLVSRESWRKAVSTGLPKPSKPTTQPQVNDIDSDLESRQTGQHGGRWRACTRAFLEGKVVDRYGKTQDASLCKNPAPFLYRKIAFLLNSLAILTEVMKTIRVKQNGNFVVSLC